MVWCLIFYKEDWRKDKRCFEARKFLAFLLSIENFVAHTWSQKKIHFVKGRAIKIVLYVTHMSELLDNAVCKKLTKSPPHHQAVPCHYLHDVTLNDWLTACLSSCQTENPTAMCRPTLIFFFSFLLMPSIPSFFTSCLFEDFLSGYCLFAFFPSTC